ncbi:MAG: RluA family pseudouridine synthase [Pirellulales bacterium]|nr:RluA family pseudouridine synthase [Pirellulales bacterium]
MLLDAKPCLAVCKPPGVPTQAPPGIDSLEVRIKSYLRERSEEPEKIYLGTPHRLDRPASGAMVFGLRRRATRKLARQFELRTVKKLYWALVEGRPDPPFGTWRDHLIKVHGRPLAEVVSAEHPDARPAVLRYRTVSDTDAVAWLEIELETGRTHQVRIQAASRGYPVLGDFQYGSSVPFGPQYDDPRRLAIALHARTLEFDHPASRERISVTAPPPVFWPADFHPLADSQ